jgi:hypothetical protein
VVVGGIAVAVGGDVAVDVGGIGVFVGGTGVAVGGGDVGEGGTDVLVGAAASGTSVGWGVPQAPIRIRTIMVKAMALLRADMVVSLPSLHWI